MRLGRCALLCTGIIGRYESISDDEMSQLYWQFTLFDIDEDGFISLEDLMKVVGSIDPALSLKPNFKEKCQNWFGPKTFYPRSEEFCVPEKIQVDFERYVATVFNFRAQSRSYGTYDSLNFPFWSLRDCVVYTAHRHLEGWAWERSTYGWSRRHFRMHKEHKTDSLHKIELNIFKDDKPTSPLQSALDLRDLVSVTFSPGSPPPSGKDVPVDVVVFKLLFSNGKRRVLAADEKTAVRWSSIFSWYACGGRLIQEWRIQYGDVTKDVITMNDWVKAGICIVNLQTYLKLQEEYKEMIQQAKDVEMMRTNNKATERQIKMAQARAVYKIVRTAEKSYQTPRQRLILKLCGISEDNFQNSLQLVQAGIYIWRKIRSTVWNLDAMYCYGGIKTGIFVIKNGIVAYRYGVAVKNTYKETRYGVAWQDKSSCRECSVCKDIFSTFAIRTTAKKHHCRSCGRVVCHACSTNLLYLEVTGKVKRVCDECLVSGRPPAIVDPLNTAAAVTSVAVSTSTKESA
jgi:hypothetical protein